ncbi:MAG: excinuclease ABC subunit UvrA, partial [Lentisphaerae bacterium]|nr:excinuclease ABC subunit UvrA [Lentisphaerota bacterium]
MQKPDVEHIEGLSPAIAIEQRTAGSNPRSTVATTTEIYDYLRLLYAHIGKPHCPKCGVAIKGQSAEAICEKLLNLPPGRKMMILAPYVSGRKGEQKDIIDKLKRDGFVRARIDGEIYELDGKLPKLEKNIRHGIDAIVDRLVTGKTESSRLNDSVELALRCGEGIISILLENPDDKKGKWIEEQISEQLACVKCGISFGQLAPRNFSFNSPYGACPVCNGLGTMLVFAPELVVPDSEKPIKKGAIPAWRRGPRRLLIYYNHLLRCIAEHYKFPDMTSVPFKDIPKKIQDVLINGSGDEIISFDYWRSGKMHKLDKPFEGVLKNLQRRFVETESEAVRERLKNYMRRMKCTTCDGHRLRPESLAVKVGNLGIHKYNELTVSDADLFFEKLKLTDEEKTIAHEVVREIRSRLAFLKDVGLSYLTLNRESGTLSGGEAQRIRLATQIGSGLTGVLYILDEPSIGLHQRDNFKLLNTLEKLRDTGNTVIVVEHDLDTIRRADYVIDLGPGAGRHGGEVVAAGTPAEVEKTKTSITGKYLSGEKSIPLPKKRVKGNGTFLSIEGAEHNNLKKISVKIPLGTFCCVTGVSGSGKSSLIDDTLRVALDRHFDIGTDMPGKHKRITGLENIGKAIVIDQSPIGRTPRSNPATYTDAFGIIRDLYSRLPESKMRGYKSGRFSFNVKGGRCEECKGDGMKKIEMQFLPEVYVTCSACKGRRFNRETLSVLFKGRSIADVLEMTVSDASEFFSAIPKLHRKLKTLEEVGLCYIHLGQPATTLSGGEAQRVKLSAELARIPRGHTLCILDEPTTGLHIADVDKLLEVLMRLRDHGNTVLVVEHNLELIKTADHIIDLGPDGGDKGGRVVAVGTPEQVAACEASHTGRFLRPLLASD